MRKVKADEFFSLALIVIIWIAIIYGSYEVLTWVMPKPKVIAIGLFIFIWSVIIGKAYTSFKKEMALHDQLEKGLKDAQNTQRKLDNNINTLINEINNLGNENGSEPRESGTHS